MSLEHAFISHVGCWRNENQDNFWIQPTKNVFAVADGMGGLSEGSMASRLACKAFSYQADHDPHNIPSYFQHAHELVIKWAQKNGYPPNKIGTTGVVVQVDPIRSNYIVCWCGDSRLYHYKAATKALEQITSDHSYVQGLVDRGILTTEEAAMHSNRHIITHAIGIGSLSDIKVGTKKKSIEEGDILILCTDGLNNEVSFGRINELCTTYSYDPQLLCEHLIGNALNGGGHDNVTVGVLRWPTADF